ncbi:MAG: site-2 protease family protein [Clostridia bacterium]|nr:site-2 protease family protein [Clostridia bacterium]
MLYSVIHGDLSFQQIIIFFLSSLAVILLVLPIHEFAHGWTASKLGDPTPKYGGRLTLNPMAHIDWLGALCIVLFGFGWAKPVGVNPRYFKNPKRDMAITAAAGPLSNLLIGFLFMFFTNLTYFFALRTEQAVLVLLSTFFYYIVQINVGIAIFNLIPIPPFDGSRLLSALLPDKYYYKLMQNEQYFMIGIFILMFTGVLDRPLSFLTSAIIRAFDTVTAMPFSAWMG